jgi:hypothetical protein
MGLAPTHTIVDVLDRLRKPACEPSPRKMLNAAETTSKRKMPSQRIDELPTCMPMHAGREP